MKDTESALVPRTPIGGQAFLGLGAMDAGHDLTVWNRKPEAAQRLVASSAKRASSPEKHPREMTS
jgi:3-hydroxyisobutyrate dehydrogenase-like beta-hydroxyacid dehydrogenase